MATFEWRVTWKRFLLPIWAIDAAAQPSVLAGRDGKTSARQLLEHNLLGTVNLLRLPHLQCRAHFR